jgi:uncharacterized protein (TIRG00374 family)
MRIDTSCTPDRAGAPPRIHPMTESAAASPATRRRVGPGWKLFARLAVTGVLLAVLAWKAQDLEDTIPDRDHTRTLLLLFAALVMALIGVVLSAWRWQRVLLLFDAHVPIRTLTSHYLASLFVGNVLPSTIGGDVLRVTRVSNNTDSTSIGFGSVVIERLTGFVALPLLVALGFIIRPSLLDASSAWIALLVAGITVVVLAILLFLAGHPRIAGRFSHDDKWTRFIGAVHVGVDRLRREPGQLFPVIGTAIVYQLSVVCMFAFIFWALDIPLPLAGLLAFAPAVLMLQVLPISLGGFGIREGALVLFLHKYLSAHDLPNSRAVAAGLLWYLCMLVVSMLGAPAFASGNRKRQPAESGTQQ